MKSKIQIAEAEAMKVSVLLTCMRNVRNTGVFLTLRHLGLQDVQKVAQMKRYDNLNHLNDDLA